MPLSRFAALALLGFTLPAFSDVVYTYTGPNFTKVSGAYTTSDYVTGSITFAAPLKASSSFSMIPLPSFSFSDGVQTITNATANLLQIEDDFRTDASGAITSADVILITGSRTGAEYEIAFGIESTDVSSPSGQASSPDWVVGTWTGPDPVVTTAATPEPSTFALLATGLLGPAAAIRRRIAA